MNVLLNLISELDGYTLGHIQQKLETNKSKLFRLFQLYKPYKGKQGIDVDEKVMKQLFGPKSNEPGRLSRLKHRLVNEMNEALIELNTAEGKSTFLCEQNLILYKIFHGKGMEKLAKYYLEKAEKQAISSEQFEYLDIIYGLYIQLGKETLYNDPAVYIEKRKANSSMLSKLRQIDDILAVISYRLKVTQNLGEKLNVSKEVNKTINKFSTDPELLNSVQFKIKMYKTISQIFVQQKKFVELEHYLTDIFEEFEKTNVFNKNTHDTKIEILVYIINTLLMLKKQSQALVFGEKLHSTLLQFDKVLYKKYIYFYYQAKINAESVINPDKAIETTNEIINDKSIVANPYYSLLTYSNLVQLYYIKGNYKQVIRSLQKIYIHEFYEKADVSLKVPLAMLELITRIDMGDLDIFENRLVQIKEALNDEWKSFEGPEKAILPLVEAIGSDSDFRKNKRLKEKAREFISSEGGNTNIFNYNGWLTAKLKLDY